MVQRTLLAAVFMVATISTGTAEGITNGIWSSSGCGVEPVVPVIEQSV